MAKRAALITGASSGIGLAMARALGEDGYSLTISARRPEKLETAAEGLRAEGHQVLSVPANMTDADELAAVFEKHREAYGRLDVLINNAGVGIGAPLESIDVKHLDMQVDLNFRAVVIGTREGITMLREAGEEHGNALIINMASIAGKGGQPWLSIYGASKAAVVNFSQATQKEVGDSGIQVTAFCPGFVDTAMTEFVKGQVDAETMIRPEDIAEAMRFLLRTSRNCLIPEIVFTRPGEMLGAGTP